MKTVAEMNSMGRRSLRGRTEHPARDAAVLLAHVLGKQVDYVYLHPEALVPEDSGQKYRELIQRRARGEPLAYLRGYQEFMGLRFKVDRRVLIPRPETEVLVETALHRLNSMVPRLSVDRIRKPPGAPLTAGSGSYLLVADVCCGCGNIAISLARYVQHVVVIGVDVSAAALDVARGNARELGVSGRVVFVEGDLFEPLERMDLAGHIDVVTANPPYIPSETIALLPPDVRDFEPLEALDGGPAGLSLIRRIVSEAPRFLRSGGLLFMEIGFDQKEATMACFAETGQEYSDVTTVKDYAGRERLVVAARR